MNFRNYIKAILFLTILCLSVVGFLNWYIDPYGYWGRIPFGIYGDGTFRHLKARILAKGGHPALIFGASTTVGTNPDVVPECKFYNAAFNGQRPTEVLYVMRNFVASDTKLIVVFFDFFVFNQTTEIDYINPDFGKYSLKNMASYTLSTTALKQSRYTTREWYRIRKGTRKVGSAINPNGQREIDSIVEADARKTEFDFAKEMDEFHNAMLVDYKFSEARISTLEEIKEEASRKNIRLVVAINPMSEFMHGYIASKGMEGEFVKFRTALKSVFPDIIDFSQSEFSANSGFLKNDPVHFHPDTGAKILQHVVKQSKACP